MEHTKPSFYITTPIYYVNAAPHLGTAYSTILADVQARFRRAAGYDVKFLTGLDEHGEKVAQSAAAHGMTPQAWCDSLVPAFRDLWSELEITNDDFIRTTQDRQPVTVQHLWEVLKEKGYVYKGSYDGWYCVPEERQYIKNTIYCAILIISQLYSVCFSYIFSMFFPCSACIFGLLAGYSGITETNISAGTRAFTKIPSSRYSSERRLPNSRIL